MMLLLLVSAVLAATAAATPRTVLITGATGRTGRLLYAQLKAHSDIAEVRALVRSSVNATNKARAVLNCTKCDASEGVFYGDVTIPSTLEEPMAGIDTLAITVGVVSNNETLIKAVEFTGVENQVAALAMHSDVSLNDKRVILLSSMGTTYSGYPISFWKLNAETFIGYSGIGSAVVKPCGLGGSYGRGGKKLVVNHDDNLSVNQEISREDVAAVLTEIIVERATSLRFDLCVSKGAPTTDLSALLDAARMPWMKNHI